MSVVDAICPNLRSTPGKRIHATMNSERWMRVVDGALNIPPDNVLRVNMSLLDKLIEVLHVYEKHEEAMTWDDSAIVGQTKYEVEEALEAIQFLKQQKRLSVDIETRHVKYTADNKILLIGFAHSPTEAISFAPPAIDNAEVRKAFGELLTSDPLPDTRLKTPFGKPAS